MPTHFRGKSLIVPLVISGLGVMTVATAQTTSSPFAKKTKKQAWETEDSVPSAPAAPSSIAPSSSSYSDVEIFDEPLTVTPSTNSLQDTARNQIESSSYNYQPKTESTYGSKTYGSKTYGSEELAGSAPAASDSGAYYPGREKGQYEYQAPTAQNYAPRQAATPLSAAPQARKPRNKWLDKFGLGGIKLAAQGFMKIGGAFVDRAGEDEKDFDFVAHGRLELEASAITDGGMEYGVNLELREDYDRYRRGFGGRVGDCPPGVAGCNGTLVAGVPTGLRGHTSQFYSSGPSNATETQVALESAHLFLRTAYGDVTAGRDDGAAYLFSLGAPSLMIVNASNSAVDYTGLDSVKTVNDASGFSEKITYTTPRLLGDKIGVGVQLGASYAFNARACGVDYCVRKNSKDESGTLAPDLKDVMEVGLSLDRKFDNGLKVEATATYATAKNEIVLAGFDDLQAWNTGLEISLGDWTAGGSYLQSNNALSDGDYTAYDAGITWKPSAYGFTASYGHANDKNVDLKSDQFVFGVMREFERFSLGTGVQYIERTTPLATGNIISSQKEKATAVFIEGGFKF
ncbi:porin [Hellea balneolensis]|uniref:porin n=1 Tax=Hellea balneolensis TaxID=287478 RepID=UPI0004098896|nr:porin [Hellea balneolensis]